MRLIQFETATGQRHVGVVEGEYVLRVCGTDTTRELAQQAIAAGRTLADHVQVLSLGERHDYRALLAEGRVLPPLDHPDPAVPSSCARGQTCRCRRSLRMPERSLSWSGCT